MKDLSEAAVSVVLAFCGIAICYWILGEYLAALFQQTIDSIRP